MILFFNSITTNDNNCALGFVRFLVKTRTCTKSLDKFNSLWRNMRLGGDDVTSILLSKYILHDIAAHLPPQIGTMHTVSYAGSTSIRPHLQGSTPTARRGVR